MYRISPLPARWQELLRLRIYTLEPRAPGSNSPDARQVRKAVWPAVFVLLAGVVDSRHVSARGNPQRLKPVILNLIVTDHAGNPVADLVQSDFRVVDNGSVQRIASLRTNAANSRPPLVILFDLLNLNFQARGAIAQTLRQSMARLPRQLAAEFNRVLPRRSVEVSGRIL